MMRVLSTVFLAAALLGGAMVLIVFAGTIVGVATDPFYPFIPFFAPVAVGIIILAAYLMGRLAEGMFAGQSPRRIGKILGWVLSIGVLGLFALGIGRLLAGPTHWQ